LRYSLDAAGELKPDPDLMAWARGMMKPSRSVASTLVGESTVSTVFLGYDASFGLGRSPTLWETMVLGGRLDRRTWRCGGSREQAEAMHAAAAAEVARAERGGL